MKLASSTLAHRHHRWGSTFHPSVWNIGHLEKINKNQITVSKIMGVVANLDNSNSELISSIKWDLKSKAS